MRPLQMNSPRQGLHMGIEDAQKKQYVQTYPCLGFRDITHNQMEKNIEQKMEAVVI